MHVLPPWPSGSLPADADHEQALAWIDRQRDRWTEGLGFSFAVADVGDDRAVGTIGLHLRELDQGQASAGYAVAPTARGRRVAGRRCDIVLLAVVRP